MDTRQNKIVAWGAFLFLCLVWGSSFILIKKALIAFSPYQIAGLRMVIAALFLLPFVIGKARKLSKTEWKFVALVGTFGNGIPAFLFPLAETKINSANAGIMNALSPLFVLIIGFLLFDFRFSARQITGVLTGLAGALILILSGGSDIGLMDNIQYSLIVVVATILYGFSTNIMKRYLNQTPPVLASGFALLTVAIPYSLYLLFADIPAVFQHNAQAWSSLGYIVILGGMGTSLALVLFYRLVQVTGPVFASSVTYFLPVVALMWGLLDNEKFTLLQFAGMAVILVGVYLSNRK
ncbi:MAG: EamA family transporter [Bacteroidia bacterium]